MLKVMDVALKRARIGRNFRRVVNTFWYLWLLNLLILAITGVVFVLDGDFEKLAQTAWTKSVRYIFYVGGIPFGLLLLYLGRRERKCDEEEIYFHRLFSRELKEVLFQLEAVADETWSEEKLRRIKQEIVEWRPATLKVPDEEREKEVERRVQILYDLGTEVKTPPQTSLVPVKQSRALQRIAGEFENLTDEEWAELIRLMAQRDGKDGPEGNVLH